MKNIAIIEQTNILQIRIKKLLERNGFDGVFPYGYDVLNSVNVKSKLKEMDIFIIDLDYNQKTPESIIKEVKKYTDDKIIMALTKNADISFLKRMIALGCNDFVLKPFNDQKLVLKIRRHIHLDEKNNAYKEFTLTDNSIKDDAEIELSWFKDYSIGVKEIDLEHKELVEVYQNLYHLMKKGKGIEFYNKIIEFLQKYIKNHFKNEEALQQKIGYKNYKEHCKIHEDFKKSLKKIIARHESKEITNEDLIKINLFLRDWLMHHILIEDHKIGEFIKNKHKKNDL
jgi:hemerythrin